MIKSKLASLRVLSAVPVRAQAVQSYGGLVALVVVGLLYIVLMIPVGVVVCCCRCCCPCCKLCGGRHRDYDGACSKCTRRVCGGLLILTVLIATYACSVCATWCSSPLLHSHSTLRTLTAPSHYSVTLYTPHSTLRHFTFTRTRSHAG